MRKISAALILSLAIAVPACAEETDLSAWLEKSRKSYAAVEDYTAIFYKKEISKGAVGEPEEIFMKFEKPFKIFMGWTNTAKKGLQVVYERGKRDGKLAIHKPGLVLGLMPVVLLPQDSPWVREGSESYDIEDAGIGTFLEDFSAAVEKGKAEGKLSVKALGPNEFEVSFPGTVKDDVYFAQRIIVVFEEASGLPVGMTLYDWQDQFIGTYEYRNLRINTGHDPDFKKAINRYLYKVYKSDD